MKKAIVIYVLVLIFALSACNTADFSPENGTTESTAATSPDSEHEVSVERKAASETENQAIYDEAEVETQIEQVGEACADIIDAFELDFDKGTYPLPELEEYTALSKVIGELGHPVVYYDLDMPNHKKVLAFWDDVQAEKDAQIVIYRLHNVGIYVDILAQRNGELYGGSAIYHFPSIASDGAVSKGRNVEFYRPLYRIENMRMTDNGYLLYHIPEQDDQSPSDEAIRALPLGEENRVLCRKYVQPVADYRTGGLFSENWNQDDFSSLMLHNAFNALYYAINKDFPREYADYIADGEALMKIPADIMEGIMLSSFPISQEQLRSLIPYDETDQTYNFEITFSGGFDTAEVVEVVTNPDGSLTLTVDVIPYTFLDDADIMTHQLTVMDNPDGSIKYISNLVIAP